MNLLAGLFSLLLPFTASAAYDNMNSILIGDQSAGMGGAATAVASDASSGAWYNPAGLAFMPGSSFSAAVGIFKKFSTTYGSGDDLIAAATKVNQGFFRGLPSSSGSVIRPAEGPLAGWSLAFSIIVPEYDQFRGEVNRTDTNVASLSTVDESLWVGTALARKVSATEYLGVSLYYSARSLSRSVSDRSYQSPTNFTVFTEERALTQNAVVAILGYLKELDEHWRFGTSLRLPNYHIVGRANYIASKLESGQAEEPVSLTELDSRSRIPARLNVGVAYDDKERWLVAGEIDVQGPAAYEDIQVTEPGIAESIEHRTVANVALGAEYRWTEWLKTRVGLFTNFSANPDPDPARVKGQGERVNQLGFSANAAFRSGPIEYTFGGYYSGGTGEAVQRLDQQYLKISKTQNIFTMLVGTSYYF